MFGLMTGFELRYYLRQPSFYVTSILFFLLAFFATASDNVQIGGGGEVWGNGPFAITRTITTMLIFSMFLVVNFVSSAALRNHAVSTRHSEPQNRALALEQVATRIDTLLGAGTNAPETPRPTPAAEATVQVVELIAPPALETAPIGAEGDATQAQAPVAPPAFPPVGTVPAESLSQASKLMP